MQFSPAIGVPPPCPPVADRADRAQNVKLIWADSSAAQRLRLIQAWRRLLQHGP